MLRSSEVRQNSCGTIMVDLTFASRLGSALLLGRRPPPFRLLDAELVTCWSTIVDAR